jgi:sec-independent protein translocase protein TatA
MGIGIWELAIIFAIVLLVFGTKRLRNFGSDLGGAIRGFRNAMNEPEEKSEKPPAKDNTPEDGAPKEKDSKDSEETK